MLLHIILILAYTAGVALFIAGFAYLMKDISLMKDSPLRGKPGRENEENNIRRNEQKHLDLKRYTGAGK